MVGTGEEEDVKVRCQYRTAKVEETVYNLCHDVYVMVNVLRTSSLL
jgi:hypothetical protein